VGSRIAQEVESKVKVGAESSDSDYRRSHLARMGRVWCRQSDLSCALDLDLGRLATVLDVCAGAGALCEVVSSEAQMTNPAGRYPE
jgi:hypothetical protein